MRPLRGQLLLEVWERGAAGSALGRAVALLEGACSDSSREDLADRNLADLSIGQRNARLFRLRQITFGDPLRGILPCESCSTRMEFEVSVESVLGEIEPPHRPCDVKWSAGMLTFCMRPVTTRDLAQVAGALHQDARRRLLALCTTVEGADAPAALEEHERSAVEHFNRLNRNAETRFALSCPACGETAHVDLDIGRFLWAEVRHAALALLREVHELASAYGWAEQDILGMNGIRRAMYLEMART